MALKQASQLKSKEYYASLLSNPYVQAALNTISKAEGTAKGTRNVQDPYSTIVGYTSFSDFSDHPREYVKSQDSTAAGKYQALKGVWDEVAGAIGLEDFSRTNQDIFAVARIDQRGGLEPLLKGDFRTFSDKVKKEWASFPGANYAGQGMRSAAQVEKWFNEYLAAAKNTPAMMNGFRQDPFDVKTIDGVRSLAKSLEDAKIPAPASRFSGLMTPVRPGAPERAPQRMSATPTSDYRATPPQMAPESATQFAPGPSSRNQTPVLNPSVIQRMQDNLTSKMAFARPNPSNMNISGYGFSTPANPSARGSATGSINRASAVGNASVNSALNSVLGGRGNINPPNVVAEPANVLSNYDQYGNFTGNRQSSAAPTSDFRSTLNERASVQQSPSRTERQSAFNPVDNMATDLMFTQTARPSNATTFATGPTTTQSVRDAQSNLAQSNKRDQFVRDVLKSGVEVTVAPSAPQSEAAKLASQYSQYQRSNVPSAQTNPTVYDMVDVPQSSTIASQYASYGAGKIAPQQTAATTTTQSTPAKQAAPATRSVSVPGPAEPATTEQQRIDKAITDMKVGIPAQDVYDENAPGRSGFRGFGAGGFLGNLLTGNIGNMQGMERGNRFPGLIGVIQGIVQSLGGPQRAEQVVQSTLGQVMGLSGAQQSAKAGNNMVITKDGSGRIGWTSNGGLSSGAANAGWMSNNPERNYGGYGSGYDPTPV